MYLQTANQTAPSTDETAQIFVGQDVGMFLHTRSNHPISFQTYSDEPLATVTPSMKILANRDVEIYAPLKIKSTTATVIDNDLAVGGISDFGNGTASISNTGQVLCTSLGTTGDVIFGGSLTVGGLFNTIFLSDETIRKLFNYNIID